MALFTIQNDFHYDIVRKIFEGGMGIVYEAEQHGAREFVKRIAVKVIRQNYADQKQFIDNFIGEAKLVADLIHTNIVQTYHLGETRGIYFIAMELIRGVNLEQFSQQLLDRKRVLPRELAIFIVSRVARGLAYAHAKTDKDGKPLGIVHRDVSFKNIMIAFEGDVKLTDFGIAKARGFLADNEGEVVAGKADYMSPEQANFQITDKRSDLFSAGVVLAHLLLGRNIFKGAAPEESRQRMLNLAIPDFRTLDQRVDERLNQILHRALAREVAEKSVTLVRDTTRQLPLNLHASAGIAVVVPRPEDLTPADTSSLVVPALASAVRRYHRQVDDFTVAMNPSAAEIRESCAQLLKYDLIIIGTINAADHPGQAALVNRLLKEGRKVIAVALRMPYDLAAYPEAPTYLCTYSILPPAMEALADALWGRIPFNGKLPVSIPVKHLSRGR